MLLNTFLLIMIIPFGIGFFIWLLVIHINVNNRRKASIEAALSLASPFESIMEFLMQFHNYILFSGKLYCFIGWCLHIYMTGKAQLWKELTVGIIAYPYGIIFGWNYIIAQVY